VSPQRRYLFKRIFRCAACDSRVPKAFICVTWYRSLPLPFFDVGVTQTHIHAHKNTHTFSKCGQEYKICNQRCRCTFDISFRVCAAFIYPNWTELPTEPGKFRKPNTPLKKKLHRKRMKKKTTFLIWCRVNNSFQYITRLFTVVPTLFLPPTFCTHTTVVAYLKGIKSVERGWFGIPGVLNLDPAVKRFQLREFLLLVSNRGGNIVYTVFINYGLDELGEFSLWMNRFVA